MPLDGKTAVVYGAAGPVGSAVVCLTQRTPAWSRRGSGRQLIMRRRTCHASSSCSSIPRSLRRICALTQAW